MKTCEICGRPSESNRCFNHKKRKALRASFKKKTDTEELRELFIAIWKERPHYSEVSGIFLGHEILFVFFHHILLKETFSKAKFDKENIILLSLCEHSNVHSDMYKYEEINKRREYLKTKYNLL